MRYFILSIARRSLPRRGAYSVIFCRSDIFSSRRPQFHLDRLLVVVNGGDEEHIRVRTDILHLFFTWGLPRKWEEIAAEECRPQFSLVSS